MENFRPFSEQELNQLGGLYYGINEISKNKIVIDAMEKSKHYGGRDFAGNFLQEDFTVEPETISLNLITDENPDRKQVTP